MTEDESCTKKFLMANIEISNKKYDKYWIQRIQRRMNTNTLWTTFKAFSLELSFLNPLRLGS